MFFQTTLLWISEECVTNKGMDMKSERDRDNAVQV